MKLPLQITFRDMEHSDAVETEIRKKAEKLDQYHDQIISCRVVVEISHKHKHQGNLFHIIIDITIPGGEIVVNKDSHDKHSHENAYVAIRDAFDAAKRQLEDRTRRSRQKVKTHEVPPHGKVVHLSPMEDYGRLETPDGREIYFHRNSVTNAEFDKMEVGNEVRFSETTGDEGPQASSVTLVGKHHIVGR